MPRRPLLARLPLLVLLAAPTAFARPASGPLPLKAGTYVLADTPCADAPFAAMRSYDGRGLGGPHASACTTRVLARHGRTYRVATTCTANGDGSPAVPDTVRETLRVPSASVMVVESPRAADEPTRYRFCGSS